MGHCIHGKSGLCLKAGVECYQNGLYKDNKNMSVEDFRTRLKLACPNCDKRKQCMGGCPIKPEVVLCKIKKGIEYIN